MTHRLLALIALLVVPGVASAQTWTASGATSRYDTVNEHSFTYDFTDVTHSDGFDVSGCDESLTAALDGSIGDTSTDSRIRLWSCPAEQNGTAPDSADSFAGCSPALSGVRGEFSAVPIANPNSYTRVEVITSPVSDTSRLTLACKSRNQLWDGSTWVDDGLMGAASELGPLTMTIPFCGQGGAASTDRYLGPSVNFGLDMTPGGVVCDALDDATAADADALPYAMNSGYTVRGMFCQLDSGTDDTVEMTLYDDTAATAVTCTITAAGGVETCSVESEVAVAAGSLMAILVDNDDDNLSAQDLACWVFAELD